MWSQVPPSESHLALVVEAAWCDTGCVETHLSAVRSHVLCKYMEPGGPVSLLF